MNRRMIFMVIISFIIFGMITACATLKTREKLIEGIQGQIVLVNKTEEEISSLERENILINCVPLKNGSQLDEQSITYNPDPDGSFFLDLKSGEYSIEIFQKGFHVISLRVDVKKDQISDVGEIELREIEVDRGVPIKGGGEEDVIMNEGDVNIQPPS
jgi:hypothetical protein